MNKLIHETTKAHYEEYATITGGEARVALREVCMNMIVHDVTALREADEEDKHLNNIDKVMRKAKTLMSIKGFGENPKTGITNSMLLGLQTKPVRSSYHKQKQALEREFSSRCIANGLSPKSMMSFIRGPYTSEWFLAFDMQAPIFVRVTREGRAKWKEVNGGMHSGGVSNSTICSGLKHVLIFDILGCEFVEEARDDK